MNKDGNIPKPPLSIQTPEKEPDKPPVESVGLVNIDEDTRRALDTIVQLAFNFPLDRIWSWSRWKPWEINTIASELTRLCVIDPRIRPKNPDGSPRRIALILLQFIGLLRLGEKGALRGEAKDMFQMKTAKEEAAEGWPSNVG
jgi:hypothetical protein